MSGCLFFNPIELSRSNSLDINIVIPHIFPSGINNLHSHVGLLQNVLAQKIFFQIDIHCIHIQRILDHYHQKYLNPIELHTTDRPDMHILYRHTRILVLFLRGSIEVQFSSNNSAG